MKFAEPTWLLAGLFACSFLLWTWRRYDRRQRAALGTFASSHLLPQLTATFSRSRRNLKRGLFFASVALLFAALARPQAGYRWEQAQRRGIEILFAVDTSKSMLTPDVKPDRLTRAKMAVDDFVSRLDGDGVGLIAFAGDAFLQCPITLDYDAFNESLAALDTNTIPHGGTDISSAIREAQAALQDRPGTDKILILLTDGEDLQDNAVDTAKAAAQSGLKIYTVGVGSSNGDLIPLPAKDGGGFVKDDAGQYVRSHLDEKTLQAIAQATGGMYAPLGAQSQGLDTIYQQALAPLHKHNLSSRQERIYIERYQWFLAPALALLLGSLVLGNRRTVRRPMVTERMPVPTINPRRRRRAAAGVAALLALGLLASLQARASVTAAQNAYQKGDYPAALREFEADAHNHPQNDTLQFDAGTAAYKAGQYQQAADDFQKSLGAKESPDPKQLAAQEDAYYNLGNTLYRAGQKTQKGNVQQTIQTWEQAVKSYEASLQLRKDDADSTFNRDFVQRKIDELKKQQQQQQKQNQQSQNQQKKSQQQKQGQGSHAQNQQDKSGQGKSDAQNQPNQSGQGSQQQNQQTAGNQGGQGQPKSGGGQQPQQESQANSGSQPNPAQPNNSGQKQPGQSSTAQNGAGQQPQNQSEQANNNSGQQGQNQQPGSRPQNQDQQANNNAHQSQGQPPSTQQGTPTPGSGNSAPGSGMAQNGAQAGQPGQTAERPVPGQMSKEEARQLLDSLRGEQRNMPGAQVARAGTPHDSDQPIKDW
jgi:Ca-activated chloride channel family protein